MPAFVGAVNVFVWPGPMSPVLNWPPEAVSVWVTESLLVTRTVDPGATATAIGVNMKFEMVSELVATGDAEAPAVPESPPPLHADSSRAAATMVTTAPLLTHRFGSRIAQTALGALAVASTAVSIVLPRLTGNQTYQLWGIVDTRPVSLGLLGGAPSQAVFTMAGAKRPSRLSITAEPSGGSVIPTGPILATGTV